VDGRGHRLLQDDANAPNLLSAPYFGFCDRGDPVYQHTRQMVLSSENPYYYEGKLARGVGSRHTFPARNRIWHIALAMQGLTAETKAEKLEMIQMMARTDAGTGYMHEAINVNDPTQFTRPWFSWANMMYCALVLDYLDIKPEN
jgi:hypothetical protein